MPLYGAARRGNILKLDTGLNTMNEEHFANALYKALTTVTKLAELLHTGPSKIARGEKEEKYHVFAIWDYEGKDTIVLRFHPKDGDEFGMQSHIRDDFQGPSRVDVDNAMRQLFDGIAIKEQTLYL